MGGAGPYAFSAANGDLIISSDQTGVYNAYRLNTATGEMTALTESTDRGVYAESWFPEDDRFIYQQDGNETNSHVFVMSEGGEVTDLTPGEGHKLALRAGHPTVRVSTSSVMSVRAALSICTATAPPTTAEACFTRTARASTRCDQ